MRGDLKFVIARSEATKQSHRVSLRMSGEKARGTFPSTYTWHRLFSGYAAELHSLPGGQPRPQSQVEPVLSEVEACGELVESGSTPYPRGFKDEPSKGIYSVVFWRELGLAKNVKKWWAEPNLHSRIAALASMNNTLTRADPLLCSAVFAKQLGHFSMAYYES